MDQKLEIQGKNYISARRASEISGYNSDYLGQMCRADKLDCKLVSRAWFVEESSLRNHQKSNGRKKYGLRDHVVEENEFFNQNEKILINSIGFNKLLENKKVLFLPYSGNSKLLLNLFLAIFISSSITFFVNSFNNDSLTQNKLISKYKNNFESNVQMISDSGLAFLNLEQMKNNFSNNYFSLKTKVKILVFALLRKDNNYLAQETYSKQNNSYENFSSDDDRGAVMIPVSKSDVSSLSRVRSYLRNSFSDEIEIVPDDSGVSGVIKPVFADPNSEEYFYVMVPIK